MRGFCHAWGAFGLLIDWLGSEGAEALEGLQGVGGDTRGFQLGY